MKLTGLKSFQKKYIDGKEYIIYEDYLVNAIDNYPDRIPCENHKDIIRMHDYLLVSNSFELFWIYVLDINDEKTKYFGVICNKLRNYKPYNFKDLMIVDRNNIIDTVCFDTLLI